MILANSRHGPEETFHRCTSMVFPSEGRMPIPTHLRRRWSHKLERPSVPKLLSGVEAPAKLEYPFWTIIWGRNRLRLYLSKHILGVDFWQPSYHAGDALIASQIHTGTFCALLSTQRGYLHRLHPLDSFALLLLVDCSQQGTLAAT